MDVQPNTPVIGAVVAVVVAALGLLGRAVSRMKPRVERDATVIGGYGKLVDDLQVELIRLEKRIEALETNEERLRDRLRGALERIDELERENRMLRGKLTQLEGNGAT